MKKPFIQRLKANQLFRKTVQIMTLGFTMLAPTIAFAADSPESKYQAVISGISNLLLGLAIPAAVLASIIYALQYKFAGSNAHKKAEIIDSIKGTAGILIFVLTAGLIMNWIASLVQ